MSLLALLLAAAAPASLPEAVRAQVIAVYGPDCGQIEVPDRALISLDLRTGLGPPVALSFGRIECLGSNRFYGTGGTLVQLWAGRPASPAIVLEQMMFAFAVERGQLVAWQHGAHCNQGGAELCRVTFLWDPRVGRLVPESAVLETEQLEVIVARSGVIATHH